MRSARIITSNNPPHFFVTGTFGQSDPWDVYSPSTYQHPHVPYDVLVDPLSMPDHPVIGEKLNTHQVIHEDSARASKSDVSACTQIFFSNEKEN